MADHDGDGAAEVELVMSVMPDRARPSEILL